MTPKYAIRYVDESIKFTCTSSHDYHVMWTKNGQPLEITLTNDEYTVEIEDLYYSDKGTYECHTKFISPQDIKTKWTKTVREAKEKVLKAQGHLYVGSE